jgi:rRNA-processing protein FCF1
LALKDIWQDLQDAVAGVENSGSDISVEPINAIAHAVIDNENNKVDKVEGKGLSTNDFTNEEKNKINANAKKIDYLEQYGESEVIVLTNDEVIIEGNRIVGTRNGKVLNYQGKTVAIPEGIVEIADGSGAFFETADYMIYCDKFICSSTMQNIGESTVLANDIILSDVMREVILDSNAIEYSYSGNITLTNSSTEIWGYISEGSIIVPAHITQIELTFYKYDGNLYVYNPQATMNCELNQSGEESTNTTIYGYAGSTAEAFAKENGHTFVNMGSDYSAEFGDIESAVDHILELDNSLLGGDAL